MSLWDQSSWVCAALVTPIDDRLEIDAARLAAFGARLLGTGPERAGPVRHHGRGARRSAPSSGSRPPPGWWSSVCRRIGWYSASAAAALADQAWLGRQAGALGLAGVLATPPFFFRDVDQEGVYAFYAALAEALGPEAPPLLLYHIPQVCGVPVAVETVARLVDAYPDRIRGIKDSGADLAYTRALLAAVGGRTAVLVGAERHLPDAMPAGARGTICGLANLVPGRGVQARRRRYGRARADRGLRDSAQRRAGDPDGEGGGGDGAARRGWARCVPPLRPVGDEPRPARWRPSPRSRPPPAPIDKSRRGRSFGSALA